MDQSEETTRESQICNVPPNTSRPSSPGKSSVLVVSPVNSEMKSAIVINNCRYSMLIKYKLLQVNKGLVT